MKKISLKKLNIREVEKLSREQLKNVLGGWTGESGTDTNTGETGGEGCTVECICSYGTVTLNCDGLSAEEVAMLCFNGC